MSSTGEDVKPLLFYLCSVIRGVVMGGGLSNTYLHVYSEGVGVHYKEHRADCSAQVYSDGRAVKRAHCVRSALLTLSYISLR